MKLLAVLMIYVISVIVSVLIMIHGWGLDPKSWGWIIGGAFFQLTMLVISASLNNK